MTLPFENDTSRIVKRLAKQNMKANRRTSISIMVAILIASTFLCSLCTFVQSYWNQSVQQEIAAYGDWDGNRSKTRIACVKSDVISQSER